MQHISTPEQWRPVVGYEGKYEVSDHGRVRSLDRVETTKAGVARPLTGRVLVQSTNGRGYLKVTLRSPARQVYVHTLVLEAFVGPRPEGLEARHHDDVREHNYPSNLVWGTRSENNYDRVRNGGHPMAAKTHCVRGHEFTPDNIYWTDGGRHRHCKPCTLMRNSRYRSQSM